MGKASRTYPTRRSGCLAAVLWLLLGFWLPNVCPQIQPTSAITVPLLLPGGLSYDSAGNLFFAETGKHAVRRVSPGGVLTTVVGTGEQGFAGDGGAATAAMLDSPSAVAVDAAGNLFVADAHNHRIRRVDAGSGVIMTVVGTGVAGRSASGAIATAAQIDLPAALAVNGAGDVFFADARTHLVQRMDHASGVLTTVAGNGTQGFSGDGGAATSASMDAPSGLAVDAGGNVYLADTHNQRVRRVDAVTGVITSVAGTGQPGFSGDGGAAAGAALRLPRGLAVDAGGGLYLADSSNHRIRRIDLPAGSITTIAGDGTQGFAGDPGAAVGASLDSPRAVTVVPGSLVPGSLISGRLATVSDTGNQRVRQVDAGAAIQTVAGLGTTSTGVLTVSAPSVVMYGTGAATATLAASAATGTVTFFDSAGGAMQTLASVPLAGNAAGFGVGGLGAGGHRISATYGGDGLHSAAQSGAVSLTVSPAAVVAVPASVGILYGQGVPTLTGTLSGVLARDSGAVTLALSSGAGAFSAAATYPISATLVGAWAGNYALTASAAEVTIARAPTVSTLTGALAVHVDPTTAGVASGTVSLLDGAAVVASAALSGVGDASFAGANLSLGSHTLMAAYAGNSNLLGSSSAPLIVTIGGGGTVADFSLAATGQTSVTVAGGSAATFSFAVTPVNGALSSPIQLTVSGLPTGATASFNPAYLPPSGGPSAFILTIQTAKTAGLRPLFSGKMLVYAGLLPLLLVTRRRRRVAALLVFSLMVMAGATGCGDRIANSAAASASARTYNITVLGTATSASGGTLQHTAGVTLTLQ